VCLFCYFDVLQISEYVCIKKSDVQQIPNRDHLVKIIHKKTDKAQLGQTFVVLKIEHVDRTNPLDLYQEYSVLCERNKYKWLWLTWDLKKYLYFKNTPIRKNIMTKFPKLITEFLELSNPLLYTEHSLYAISAMILADVEIFLENLKRHG
jgi:hypothetical protein